MRIAAGQQTTYALGDSEQELERLELQAKIFAPFTRQLFEQAGISSGMRILDVGCGAGDVTFMAAELVGPDGEVVGADISASAIEWAARRAHKQRVANVKFIEGDPALMTFDQSFDAVVGRLVLMYYSDPASALTKLTAHARAHGTVAFQEFDMTNLRSFPAAPTFERTAGWIKDVLRVSGTQINIGLHLYSLFLSAGLPEPALRMDADIRGGAQFPYEILAATVQNLLPAIEKLGIATAAEVEITTLAKRMRDEVFARNGVALSPALIGAWSRKAV